MSEESVINKEITLPDEEKMRTHESDEQFDDVSVSDEQSVYEESVSDGEITQPDHSVLPDKEIILENALTEEKLFKIFSPIVFCFAALQTTQSYIFVGLGC